MIVLNAQQLQRLAEVHLRVERLQEREGGDASRVREELEDVASRVRVNLDVVRLLDPPSLVEILSPGEGTSSGRLWAAAELLFLDGIVARAEGREAEAEGRLAKARFLYRRLGAGFEVPEEMPAPDARLRRIDELADEAPGEGDG